LRDARYLALDVLLTDKLTAARFFTVRENDKPAEVCGARKKRS